MIVLILSTIDLFLRGLGFTGFIKDYYMFSGAGLGEVVIDLSLMFYFIEGRKK